MKKSEEKETLPEIFDVLPVTAKVMIYAAEAKSPPKAEKVEEMARDEVRYKRCRTCSFT